VEWILEELPKQKCTRLAGSKAESLKSLLRHTQPDENENGNASALCRINDAFSNINYCQAAARGSKDTDQDTQTDPRWG